MDDKKRKTPKMQATPGGTTYIRPDEMEWQETRFEKTWVKVLYENPDSGEMTVLVRLEPGAHIPMHKHPELEQGFILEGSMSDHDGTARKGDYVWRKGGSCHENHTDEGALLFAVYRKPNIYQNAVGFGARKQEK